MGDTLIDQSNQTKRRRSKTMKIFGKVTLAAWIVAIWALGGCAKAPTSEIEATQKSVEATRAAGSSDYLPNEDKALSDKLNAAMQEIKTQDEKMALFRNYEQAEKMLVEVRQEADQLQTVSAQKKEEAKGQAAEIQAAATQAVQKAQALLAEAPAGKGSEADLAALNADVAALTESMPAVQQAIDNGDYRDAISKATPIKEKADAISAEVEQAIQKVKEAEAAKAKSKKGKKKKG